MMNDSLPINFSNMLLQPDSGKDAGIFEAETKPAIARNPRTFEDYPLVLDAKEVSEILNISKAGVYNLMRSKGFPTLHIGKRMIVPRDKLVSWIDQNVSA